MKMVPTEVTETSTLSIHTPGNYPKEENTRDSQHGESLKTRFTLVLLFDGKKFPTIFRGLVGIFGGI
jgi:hypothetical protein